MSLGRTERVERLVAVNSADLLAYFLRRVDQPADAADLLSDTFVVIWRRSHDIPSNDQEARLWSFGVAKRVLSGHWRSRRRRSDATVRLRQELESVHSDESDRALDVRRAVSTLADVDQEIIRLTYWDGFSFEEVGRILDLKPVTVRSRHHRAKAALARLLDRDGSAGVPRGA